MQSIAKYSSSEVLQDEDTDGKVSIKAVRQRGRYEKEEPKEQEPPWWTSANATKQAKEAVEQKAKRQKLEEKRAEAKVKAVRNTLSTVFAKECATATTS